MQYSLRRLKLSDGTWAAFIENWQRQCDEVGDNIDGYAVDAMPVIADTAKSEDQISTQRIAWAVALYDPTTRPLAAAVANIAPIPGFDAPVLRVRQLTVCPLLDFGSISDDTYADTLIELAWGIYRLSQNELAAGHIHVHLRSPADVAYFQAFGKSLNSESVFKSVTHKGAWLRIEI